MKDGKVPLVFAKREKPASPKEPAKERRKVRTQTVTEVAKEHTDSD